MAPCSPLLPPTSRSGFSDEQEACGAACDKGSASSCHALAQKRLWDEKRDLKSVQAFETKACEGGEPAGCLSLERGAKRGWFTGMKCVAALTKRACELGDCSAACALGDAPACHSEARRLATKGEKEASEAYAATACRRSVAAACPAQGPERTGSGKHGSRRRASRTDADGVRRGAHPRSQRAHAKGVVLLPTLSARLHREYYPTNRPSLEEATLRLRTNDGTEVFFNHEFSVCRMGGCSEGWVLTRPTKKNIEQRVLLTSDHDESQWSWRKPSLSDDGTVRLMLFPTEGEGEYIVEWKWDGEDLTLQRDDVSSLREKGVRAKTSEGNWRAARSYD